jgi:hypothetical protein
MVVFTEQFPVSISEDIPRSLMLIGLTLHKITHDCRIWIHLAFRVHSANSTLAKKQLRRELLLKDRQIITRCIFTLVPLVLKLLL